MARTVTSGQLMARIRELGEIRASYVTNSALLQEINQSRLELLEKLVDVGAGDYFETSQQINVVADTAEYALPTNYFSTLGVSVLLDSGEYSNVDRYNLQDRNILSNEDVYDRESIRYRIRGDNIVFAPTPDWTATNGIVHVYVAYPADLNTSLTNETIDGFWGWEDYIVYDCLVKFIGGKEEGDATQWEKMLGKVNARIDQMKERRDRGNPDTIANVDIGLRHHRRYGRSV